MIKSLVIIEHNHDPSVTYGIGGANYASPGAASRKTATAHSTRHATPTRCAQLASANTSSKTSRAKLCRRPPDNPRRTYGVDHLRDRPAVTPATLLPAQHVPSVCAQPRW